MSIFGVSTVLPAAIQWAHYSIHHIISISDKINIIGHLKYRNPKVLISFLNPSTMVNSNILVFLASTVIATTLALATTLSFPSIVDPHSGHGLVYHHGVVDPHKHGDLNQHGDQSEKYKKGGK